MRYHVVVALILLSGSGRVDCHPDQPGPTVPARDEWLVSTTWLESHLRDSGVTILHVARDAATYQAGHIAGARFVSLAEIATSRNGALNELPPVSQLVALFERLGVGDSGRIVVYDEGKGLLAARLLFTLDYLGHGRRVALLDGGLDVWRREGRPLESEVRSIAARTFTPALNPDVLATLPVVRDISWTVTNAKQPSWSLLDARPEAHFAGNDRDPDVPRPGHIPGAVGLFWERMLASDRPVLRPAAELRKMFEDAGVKPGTAVVTYCRTGVQASFAYFAAKYLGYEAKMYDGSFMEWSRAPDTEVAR